MKSGNSWLFAGTAGQARAALGPDQRITSATQGRNHDAGPAASRLSTGHGDHTINHGHAGSEVVGGICGAGYAVGARIALGQIIGFAKAQCNRRFFI